MFSSATSTQPAPMPSTLAWQGGEMVETDESSRRPLWKMREVRGRGGAQGPRVPHLLRLRKPRRAQNAPTQEAWFVNTSALSPRILRPEDMARVGAGTNTSRRLAIPLSISSGESTMIGYGNTGCRGPRRR